MNRTSKLTIVALTLAMTGVATGYAQDKLYADEFPLGDVTLLDGPLKHARDLNIETLLKYDVDRLLAVGIDDAKPNVIDPYGNVQRTSYRQAFESGGTNWDQNVKENVRRIKTQLDIATAGTHTFKIYMVDPAVVVEKIVISKGSLPQTYFGPKFSTPVKTK